MRRLLAPLAAAALLAGCSEPETELPVSVKDATPEQEAVIAEALQVLFERCSGLRKYAAGIERVEVTFGSIAAGGWTSLNRDYGWPSWIQAKVVTKPDQQVFPDDTRIYAGGSHNLYYDMGGGPNPGVFASKSTSMSLCPGIPPKQPNSLGSFLAEPRMAVVDKL